MDVTIVRICGALRVLVSVMLLTWPVGAATAPGTTPAANGAGSNQPAAARQPAAATAARPAPAAPGVQTTQREPAPTAQEPPRARRTAMKLTVTLGGLALLALVGLILVKSVTRP